MHFEQISISFDSELSFFIQFTPQAEFIHKLNLAMHPRFYPRQYLTTTSPLSFSIVSSKL